MSKIFVSFFFSLLLLCSANHIDTANKVNNLPNVNTTKDKVLGLSKIWSEVNYNFVNIDLVSFDIDSLYEETITRVLATTNDLDYYKELQRFLASFMDGHTLLGNVTYSWNKYFDYIPFGIVNLGKQLYFSSYRMNTNAKDSILLGTEIIEIEGVSTVEYLEKYVFPYISASTMTQKWLQAASNLQSGRKGTSFTGKARNSRGEVISFSISRNGESTRTPQDVYWSPITKDRKAKRINLEWQGEIAILDIRSFGGIQNEQDLKNEIDSLSKLINEKAEGLVIDLRNNGGGITDVANHLLMYLVSSNSFLTFGAQIRINDGYGRSQGNYRDEFEDFYLGKAYRVEPADTIKVSSEITPYRCPIVILIGTYTFSAAEDFLVNLYEIPDRPLLIGETTGGSTGAPLVVSLPHGASATICTVRALFPYSNKPFIREGIHPDFEISQSIQDYLSGRDVVLAKALEILNTN